MVFEVLIKTCLHYSLLAYAHYENKTCPQKQFSVLYRQCVMYYIIGSLERETCIFWPEIIYGENPVKICKLYT